MQPPWHACKKWRTVAFPRGAAVSFTVRQKTEDTPGVRLPRSTAIAVKDQNVAAGATLHRTYAF